MAKGISGRPAPRPPSEEKINALLDRFGRFGVNLGLDRIQGLLQVMGNPHLQVPIVHVAGTNGKGSVCAYLSSVLTQAGYRVGRYTSPHLVRWGERITINQQPIASETLFQRLQQVVDCIDPHQASPTQFEVFTAAAWLHFAAAGVDLAVIEVGLGGRLDATNVVDAPLVTVITSLSREHWQRLGPTLADIAREKAGILKPGRPAVIGPLPPEAEAVVQARLLALRCPAVWPQPAIPLGQAKARYSTAQDDLIYALPFPGEHQLVNSALAIATLRALRQQGWALSDQVIVEGMARAQWPGRLQWVTWQMPQGNPRPLLIDGAHNPAAAKMLRQYADTWLASTAVSSTGTVPALASPAKASAETGSPTVTVVWLMGMLSTKDHRDVLNALLRPGDSLHLVPVPGHASADPADLAAIATDLCPGLAHCQTYGTLAEGLGAIAQTSSRLTVLCGSLYLIGEFFATASFASGEPPSEPPLHREAESASSSQ